MHKKATTRDIKNQQTRQLILDTADQLFREHRYEDVTIKDICQACGVSIGSFYHHFNSKEQLVELYYQHFDKYLEQFLPTLESLDAMEALRALVSHEMNYLEGNITYPTQICVMQLLSEGDSFNQDARTYYRCMRVVTRKLIQEKVVTGIAPETLNATLIRCTRGVLYDWCLHRGSYQLREQAIGDVYALVCGLGHFSELMENKHNL